MDFNYFIPLNRCPTVGFSYTQDGLPEISSVHSVSSGKINTFRVERVRPARETNVFGCICPITRPCGRCIFIIQNHIRNITYNDTRNFYHPWDTYRNLLPPPQYESSEEYFRKKKSAISNGVNTPSISSEVMQKRKPAAERRSNTQIINTPGIKKETLGEGIHSNAAYPVKNKDLGSGRLMVNALSMSTAGIKKEKLEPKKSRMDKSLISTGRIWIPGTESSINQRYRNELCKIKDPTSKSAEISGKENLNKDQYSRSLFDISPPCETLHNRKIDRNSKIEEQLMSVQTNHVHDDAKARNRGNIHVALIESFEDKTRATTSKMNSIKNSNSTLEAMKCANNTKENDYYYQRGKEAVPMLKRRVDELNEAARQQTFQPKSAFTTGNGIHNLEVSSSLIDERDTFSFVYSAQNAEKNAQIGSKENEIYGINTRKGNLEKFKVHSSQVRLKPMLPEDIPYTINGNRKNIDYINKNKEPFAETKFQAELSELSPIPVITNTSAYMEIDCVYESNKNLNNLKKCISLHPTNNNSALSTKLSTSLPSSVIDSINERFGSETENEVAIPDPENIIRRGHPPYTIANSELSLLKAEQLQTGTSITDEANENALTLNSSSILNDIRAVHEKREMTEQLYSVDYVADEKNTIPLLCISLPSPIKLFKKRVAKRDACPTDTRVINISSKMSHVRVIMKDFLKNTRKLYLLKKKDLRKLRFKKMDESSRLHSKSIPTISHKRIFKHPKFETSSYFQKAILYTGDSCSLQKKSSEIHTEKFILNQDMSLNSTKWSSIPSIDKMKFDKLRRICASLKPKNTLHSD